MFNKRNSPGRKSKAGEAKPGSPDGSCGVPPSDRGGYRRGKQDLTGEKPLSDCRCGDLICVQRIVGGGPIRRRLLEMGIYSGTQVRVVKYAPLKDPIECEIKGYHIALRVAEAQRIIVTPEAS